MIARWLHRRVAEAAEEEREKEEGSERSELRTRSHSLFGFGEESPSYREALACCTAYGKQEQKSESRSFSMYEERGMDG